MTSKYIKEFKESIKNLINEVGADSVEERSSWDNSIMQIANLCVKALNELRKIENSNYLTTFEGKELEEYKKYLVTLHKNLNDGMEIALTMHYGNEEDSQDVEYEF